MTTLEQIAQRHLDADSWADEAMMLAAMREAVEQCAKEAEHCLAVSARTEGKP